MCDTSCADESRSLTNLLSILDTNDSSGARSFIWGRTWACSSVYDVDDFSGLETYFPILDSTARRLVGD
jgi:hypothetical protein